MKKGFFDSVNTDEVKKLSYQKYAAWNILKAIIMLSTKQIFGDFAALRDAL